ncbi:hypothetical protein BC629DRAFT_1578444 [Irpex lacteus]|nr:hypothetical protein BC629DRAFT_1578444 [Irpex lacteus]
MSSQTSIDHRLQIGDVGWLSDSDTNNAIMNAFLLDGALRIGFCDPSQADQLAWINKVDLTRPPPHADKLTCRTWTMHCVRGLIEQGVVTCDDADALEQEAKEWACLHHKSAYDGVMPRPIEDSRVCTF